MKIFKAEENFNVVGTSLSCYINTTYKQLIETLGEPTWDEASGDDKVQKEWVIEYKGNIFTIYDWKTYDVDYTMNKLDRFNVSSKADATEFITVIETLLLESKKQLN